MIVFRNVQSTTAAISNMEKRYNGLLVNYYIFYRILLFLAVFIGKTAYTKYLICVIVSFYHLHRLRFFRAVFKYCEITLFSA